MKKIASRIEFKQIIANDKPVLVDFYAEWCGPCQALLPILETISQTYANDIVVAKVNVDEHPDLAAHFGVKSIPRVFIIKNNVIVDQFIGLHSPSEIDKKVKTALSLN